MLARELLAAAVRQAADVRLGQEVRACGGKPPLLQSVVAGREYLTFGPFAAFSPRFLLRGKRSDLELALMRTMKDASDPAN